jgi:hypothetical protein
MSHMGQLFDPRMTYERMRDIYVMTIGRVKIKYWDRNLFHCYTVQSVSVTENVSSFT